MNTKQQTSKEYFQSIRIIYYSLLAGPILFCLPIFYLHYSGDFEPIAPEMKNIFIYMITIILIIGIFVSDFVFKKKLNEANSKIGLLEKLFHYRSALIIRYAVLEGVAFFAIITCFITGSWFFMGMAGFLIGRLFSLNPTIDKAVKKLELTTNEKQVINNPNNIIS